MNGSLTKSSLIISFFLLVSSASSVFPLECIIQSNAAVTHWDHRYLPQVDPADSLALIAFYLGTDGPNWTNQTNWFIGPVSSWYGITVENGRVTRLEMPGNYVRFAMPRAEPDQIPAALGDLTMLEVINLESNVLNAAIPAEIGNLVNLKVLNLAGNGISGHIPAEIGNMSNLEALDLSDNQLGGALPESIGNLLRLKVLNVQNNRQLNGTVPAEVAKMLALETLLLDQNRFEDFPDVSNLDPATGQGTLLEVKLDNNELSFDDLEPNVGHSFRISYQNQQQKPSVIRQEDASGNVVYVNETYQYNGNKLMLYFPVGGSYNQYQWFKDDVAIPGATTDSLFVGPVTREAAGAYTLKITNTVVTSLTLTGNALVQFTQEHTAQWLDIGDYHHTYTNTGARHWSSEIPAGMEFPAIQRNSGHVISQGFWIGVKDWTDPLGNQHPYFVTTLGPNRAGDFYTFPIQNRLIGKYTDTIVEVDGQPSFDNEAVLDEIDPNLPADRMVHSVHNMAMGITVDRKAYAYTNAYHDNYHIVDYTYCNTGNTDADPEIELPNQTLQDVIFHRTNRWRGAEQGAWASGFEQALLGRYTLYDAVGDGYEDYPVDFTAQYAWTGWQLTSNYDFETSELGTPLFSDNHHTIMPGDSLGRLASATMVGQAVIHADHSPTNSSHDQSQPAHMSWINNDFEVYYGAAPEIGFSVHPAYERLYNQGIVLPHGSRGPNETCTDCRRSYPHFADLGQPNGIFWDAFQKEYGLPGWMQGGASVTTGYGPYEMGPGECVGITESHGVDGLSFDAATKIGQVFKQGGDERNTSLIVYDANGDGIIDTTPFDYDKVFSGTEAQTKDQWVMSARDSLFQTFMRAEDLYKASANMTRYPIPEPPRPPTRFSIAAGPGYVILNWTPADEGPDVDRWELYRTEGREDNLYTTGCTRDTSISCGYMHIATLPAAATSYNDRSVALDADYYYYLQAVGSPQPDDGAAITGSPGGTALRSGRYLTQTYTPINLSNSSSIANETLDRFTLESNYPNPFTQETRIGYILPEDADVKLAVYDILGREVAVLVQDYQTRGFYEQPFTAEGLANGVYLYVLQAGRHQTQGKMVLLK